MEKIQLFRELEYNQRIYCVIFSDAEIKKVTYALYRGEKVVDTLAGEAAGETVVFTTKISGRLRVEATLTDAAGQTRQLSESITVPQATRRVRKTSLRSGVKKSQRANLRHVDVNDYVLEIKFSQAGYDYFIQDAQRHLPLLKAFTAARQPDISSLLLPVFSPEVAANYSPGLLDSLYRMTVSAGFSALQAIAGEIEALSYVEYCTVTAERLNNSDTGDIGMRTAAACETPACETAPKSEVEPQPEPEAEPETPDFTARQTYLNDYPGLNVRDAWQKGSTGSGVNVHLVDNGLYPQHENLAGNFTLVTNRPETEVLHHGTACAGLIAAKAGTIGMTGIAHTCQLYCYETSLQSLDLLIERLQPGDIVAIAQGIRTVAGRLPAIADRARWHRIRAMTERGAIVFCAAANGGMDLSQGMVDFGDSGAILVGASDPISSRRLDFSNFNHYALLANAWGRLVATTGYGDLYGPDANRAYTSVFSGTSCACPLVAASIALAQAYAKQRYSVCLNAEDVRELLKQTGTRGGLDDGIGYQPDSLAAMEYIDRLCGQQEEDSDEEETVPQYDLWQPETIYVGGSCVSHLGSNYLAKWWIAPGVEPGLESTTGLPDGDGRPWTRI